MAAHSRATTRRRPGPYLAAAVTAGALCVFAALAACSTQTGAPAASSGAPVAAPQAPAARPAPTSYTLKMTATGAIKKGSIAYQVDATSAQSGDVSLPWSITVPTSPTPNINNELSTSATMTASTVFEESGKGSVTCTITDDTGKVVDTKTVAAPGGEGEQVSPVCQANNYSAPAAAPAAAPAKPAATTMTATGAKTAKTTKAKQPTSSSDTSYRCTNQIDYSSDPRDNATINSIGAETGKCPTPIKATTPKSAASDPWVEGQIEWCKEGHDGVPPSQC